MMKKQITSWGFIWKDKSEKQIAAQVGHNGPTQPDKEDLDLLRRLKKHLAKNKSSK